MNETTGKKWIPEKNSTMKQDWMKINIDNPKVVKWRLGIISINHNSTVIILISRAHSLISLIQTALN